MCLCLELERNIMRLVTGSEDGYRLSAQGGRAHLKEELERIDPQWTALVWPLQPGCDPDDAFSSVPYEKGFALLCYLESLVGEGPFRAFAKKYIQQYKFGTITSGEFRDFFCGHFSDRSELRRLDWELLLCRPGPPSHPLPDLTNPLSQAAEALVERIRAYDLSPSAVQFDPIQEWPTEQKTLLLDLLLESPTALAEPTLHVLDSQFHLSASNNAEVKFRWQMLCLKSGADW